MKRATGIGALVGAALLSTIASGTAIAVPQAGDASERSGTASAIADGYFEPGAHTIVKRSIPQQSPAILKVQLKSGDDVHISEPKEVCGTKVLEKTSGQGKTTLVMTVEKSVKVSANGEFGISKDELGVKLGFSLDKSITVKDETRYEVPAGKTGFVEAYPTFDQYTVTDDDGRTGFVMKPTGVCFNQWKK
ncbi:hypothetical protein ACPCUV_29610 [Streptomyces platensis]|uniref:hypothetical protein n=1 Tax=Streptomyces platensis TaxID=58346 RepID=UPI003C2EDF85